MNPSGPSNEDPGVYRVLFLRGITVTTRPTAGTGETQSAHEPASDIWSGTYNDEKNSVDRAPQLTGPVVVWLRCRPPARV